MDLDLLLDDDLDMFNLLQEEASPRGQAIEDTYDEVDELIRDIPVSERKPKLSKENNVPVPVKEMPLPSVTHVPATSAEAIMMNACATLRANGMRFISDMSTSFLTLEEFRETFYGGAEGSGSDPGDVSDCEEEDEDSLNGKSYGSASKNKKRKRATKRPNNPDAELIVSATEETMRLMGVDGNSREGKSQRRRIRNRMSAQLHRERKAMYIDALEAFVRIKESRIGQLQDNVRVLAAENKVLRGGKPAAALPEASMLSGSTTAFSSSGGSTTAESDSESISSASCPGSPFNHDIEADFSTSTSSRRVRANNGTGINGGTGVRSSGGVMRHFMPMLSVIVLFCFMLSGENGGLQLTPTSNDAAAPSSRRELLEIQSVDVSHHRRLLALPELDIVESKPFIHEMLTLPSPNSEVLSASASAGSSSSAAWKSTADTEQYAGRSSASSSDNSRALWKYTRDDMLTTLYPRGIIINDRTKNPPKERRNLRSRDGMGMGVIYDRNSRDLTASAANALISASSSSESTKALQSHILVQSGKALLDPSMTIKGIHSTSAPTQHARYSRGGLPTIGAPVHTATGASAADPNMLVMLVPTSSIRWGKSWSDSSAGTTEALLQGLRSAEGDLASDGIHTEGEEMYVELVCSIYSASLVKNATML